jgi:hypothetical protein
VTSVQYKSRTKYRLSEHSKQHLFEEDVQWFKCDKCSFMAKDKSYVKTHALVIHAPNKEESLFHCEQCSYTTKWKDCLKYHMIRHKSDEEVDWFYCFNCDYRARTKAYLKQHMFFKHTHLKLWNGLLVTSVSTNLKPNFVCPNT